MGRKRKVDGFKIPLNLIGVSLEKLLLATQNFTRPLNSLPASDLLLATPVSVDDVALAIVNAVKDDDIFGLFTVEKIKEADANVNPKSYRLELLIIRGRDIHPFKMDKKIKANPKSYRLD
ncbi:hypothetical protein POM88_040298 [Heracleum sosnowskyi]|uniref:Uncharacterized protein n=1 Tax=Heracleum sosnowskyi TaxID=360622 RepID=A0AAD8HEQ5_9APIA|nr:hypothetical protein POM88_040298 [Heracleum sosnowskyi]